MVELDSKTVVCERCGDTVVSGKKCTNCKRLDVRIKLIKKLNSK